MALTSVDGAAYGLYQYNGLSKRVRLSMNGRISYFMYDAAGQLVISHKVSDGETVERISLQNGHPLAKRTGTKLTYLHVDHLGTPIRGTHGQGAGTAVGAEVFRDFSTPYGMQPTSGWHPLTTSGFDPMHGLGSNCGVTGFTTHVKDCEMDLQYMQARYYDPVGSKFLSIDPMGFMSTGDPGMVNRYAYTLNDPVNLVDPDGRSPWGWAVRRTKGGLQRIHALKDKQSATDAARRGQDIQSAGGLKTARAVAKDTLTGPNALRKDAGHVLKDGSGKVGRSHFHNGTGSHIFYSVVGGLITVLETLESLDPLAVGARIPDSGMTIYDPNGFEDGNPDEDGNGNNGDSDESSVGVPSLKISYKADELAGASGPSCTTSECE